MRVLEPWLTDPLREFVDESNARVVLIMTATGQVVAQHGFTRSLDVMAAAALGSGILATTAELAREVGNRDGFGAVVHQGAQQGLWLADFPTNRGSWVALAVYGRGSTTGLVRLFFERFVRRVHAVEPTRPATREVLAEGFERELDASLRALFGGG